MNIVEIFLPLKNGVKAQGTYNALRHQLTEKFGGLTAFNRAPAEGLWANDQDVEKDEIVIIEVMTDQIDHAWWAGLREEIQKSLGEKEIVIRCHQSTRL